MGEMAGVKRVSLKSPRSHKVQVQVQVAQSWCKVARLPIAVRLASNQQGIFKVGPQLLKLNPRRSASEQTTLTLSVTAHQQILESLGIVIWYCIVKTVDQMLLGLGFSSVPDLLFSLFPLLERIDLRLLQALLP